MARTLHRLRGYRMEVHPVSSATKVDFALPRSDDSLIQTEPKSTERGHNKFQRAIHFPPRTQRAISNPEEYHSYLTFAPSGRTLGIREIDLKLAVSQACPAWTGQLMVRIDRSPNFYTTKTCNCTILESLAMCPGHFGQDYRYHEKIQHKGEIDSRL